VAATSINANYTQECIARLYTYQLSPAYTTVQIKAPEDTQASYIPSSTSRQKSKILRSKACTRQFSGAGKVVFVLAMKAYVGDEA
jgi:hypothetical protein